MTTGDDLDGDVWRLVLRRLELDDVSALRGTCSFLRALADDEMWRAARLRCAAAGRGGAADGAARAAALARGDWRWLAWADRHGAGDSMRVGAAAGGRETPWPEPCLAAARGDVWSLCRSLGAPGGADALAGLGTCAFRHPRLSPLAAAALAGEVGALGVLGRALGAAEAAAGARAAGADGGPTGAAPARRASASQGLGRRSGLTAAGVAAGAGRLACLRLLAAPARRGGLGAPLSGPASLDWAGASPLHRAAENGQTDCVSLLLSPPHGCDPNADPLPGSGLTPLHAAALGGHAASAAALVAAGAARDAAAALPIRFREFRGRLTPSAAAGLAGHPGLAERLLPPTPGPTARAGGARPSPA